MIIKKLRLHNFKNFKDRGFEFALGINALTGNNGVGKTNVLDAIYMLAFGKSYFHLTLSQIIHHGEDSFSIKGFFQNKNTEENILLKYKSGEKKQLIRNNKAYDKLSDHIGLIPVVMISPYDRDLISESGEVRRKFVDKSISQFDKEYLADLTAYYKILSQRNRLLKYFALNNTFDDSTLEVYSDQLAALGQKIYEKRKVFLKKFIPFLKEKYAWLSSQSEDVDIQYQTGLDKKNLKDLLKESLDRDRLLQHTTQGIHRDDFVFLINGYPIKKFGSQGQQKSFLIALKLAEYEMLKKEKNRSPILLFDDIFDKLDPVRVSRIVKWVEDKTFGQVFISDTHPDRIRELLAPLQQETKIFNL